MTKYKTSHKVGEGDTITTQQERMETFVREVPKKALLALPLFVLVAILLAGLIGAARGTANVWLVATSSLGMSIPLAAASAQLVSWRGQMEATDAHGAPPNPWTRNRKFLKCAAILGLIYAPVIGALYGTPLFVLVGASASITLVMITGVWIHEQIYMRRFRIKPNPEGVVV